MIFFGKKVSSIKIVPKRDYNFLDPVNKVGKEMKHWAIDRIII